MKLKKKSGLMGAIIALSCASLVSVGFASWVISQGDEKDVSGTIVADSVDNQVHQLTLQWVTDASGATPLGSNPQVIYGHPAAEDMTIDGAWLTNTDAAKVESLVFYLKVTCTNVNASNTIASVIPNAPVVTSTGGGTPEGKSTAGYAGALADGLVGALPTASTTATNFDANGSFVYKIEFLWGQTAFNGQNPYDYYNANLAATPAQKEAAATTLGNLNTYLTNANFSLVVTAI